MKILILAGLAGLLCGTLPAQTASAPPSGRPSVAWPPPAGQLRMIIDADAANEIDDQWAIALAIGSPERIKIEGFVAAHYGRHGGARGIAKSRESIEATLGAGGMSGRYLIKNGSDPIVYRDRLSESEGVDFIIERARASAPGNPIWLVLLGPATDGAIALLKAPDIADKLIVFWHGRSTWPQRCTNFNATNDPFAATLLFALPCRFVLFDTGTHLTMPMEESDRRIGTLGTLGRFLHEIRKTSPAWQRPDKGIFDLGDIAAFIDPTGATTWEAIDAPSVRPDLTYDFSRKRGPMLRIKTIDRDKTFRLLENALQRLARNAKSASN